MRWIDTHCHLQLDGREPRELIERAANVDWMVVPGIDAESSRAAIELARAYPDKVLPTAGLRTMRTSRSGTHRSLVSASPGAHPTVA